MMDFRESQQLKRSSSFSTSFRSVSRHKRAEWGNRFIRDHYDLVYQANPESISNRLKKRVKVAKKQDKQKKESPPGLLKYQYVPFKEKKGFEHNETGEPLSPGIRPQQYIQGLKVFRSDSKQRIQSSNINMRISQKQNFTQSQKPRCFSRQQAKRPIKEVNSQSDFGLSRFQYNQTLRGKLEVRLNHHIDFQKCKTQKDPNLIKIWYNQQDLPDNRLKPASVSSNRIHNFKSYSPHKLFYRDKRLLQDNGSGNGGMLDKVYEQQEKLLKAKGCPNFSLMNGRPQNRTNLDVEYQTDLYKTISTGIKNANTFSRSQSKRELKFGKQVIDPKRGCYR